MSLNEPKQEEKPLPSPVNAVKGGPYLSLNYDPFTGSVGLKRLLKDLALGVLSGQLTPRQASSVRSLVSMWVRVDEHSEVERLERRIARLEGQARVGETKVT